MSAADELKKMMEELSLMTQKVSESAVEIDEVPSIPETRALDELKELMKEAANVIPPAEKGIVEEDSTARIKALSERLSRSKNIVEQQDSLAPLNQKFVTLDAFNKHYNDFLLKIQQQLSSLGGGGEVKLRYLDDIDRSTIGENRHLAYNATTQKFFFEEITSGDELVGDGSTVDVSNNVISVINLPENTAIGPIEQLSFNLDHTHQEERVTGTLCWDPNDQTLNLTHPGGVTQQIGQESYAYVRNGTANTIVNGTPVMFAGAESDSGSGARLLVAPIVANGTFPSLYGLGIATQDLDPNQDGRVTVWGKVRDLNTSSFEVGDILYADPDNVGLLTNVKPTAPNNVIPLAAVLKKDGTAGEIFARPTIEQQMYYGRFTRLTDITAANPNQAYPIVFDTTEISNGIVVNGPADTQIQVPDSGFYQFDFSAQVTASSNKGIVYFWVRKNGVDVDHSTRSTTVSNGDTFNISTTIQISLDADDYVELFWARSASGIFLDSRAATGFAPSSSAATINVTQIQL